MARLMACVGPLSMPFAQLKQADGKVRETPGGIAMFDGRWRDTVLLERRSRVTGAD